MLPLDFRLVMKNCLNLYLITLLLEPFTFSAVLFCVQSTNYGLLPL